MRGTDWKLVGRKAIARNLSDIAAMGGFPVACIACAQFRPDMSMHHVSNLLDGLVSMSDAHRCPLVGGDTSIHASSQTPFSISVAVVGRAGPSERIVTRSGARVGDGLFVTGTLGGSFGDGFGRHLHFEPRLAAAHDLIDSLGERLTAMMDVSDGLGVDGGRLANASRVHIEIESSAIPCSAGCTIAQAIRDGEDYELLFTARGDVPTFAAGVPVTRIGSVARAGDDCGTIRMHQDGVWIDIVAEGWDHHSS